ncbi:MAG TPA: aminodeoxychorismate synthase component I [Gemmatimonadaceae bacterium]|nr:aminodeoxychorismate synthase component I [Gemmatimonadaceae bacterium]
MPPALPLVEELLPAPDPAACCERFAGTPHLLFLDSARDPERLGRHSYLAAGPSTVVRSKGRRVETLDADDVGAAWRPVEATTALDHVRALLAPFAAEPVPGLPPFQGGAAGFIAYDWGAMLERLPAPRYDDLALDDLRLGVYDWVIAWDHAEGRAWLISTGFPARDPADRERRAAERMEQVRRVLASPPPPGNVATHRVPPETRPMGSSPPRYPVEGVPGAADVELHSTFTRDGYLDAVRRVREYILAGDIFQANLSQRFDAPLREHPWLLYRRLRALNPAPFAAYLEFGDAVIVSASPERFLQVTADGRVEARPIKGTRPRGTGPMHDMVLGRALVESEKDRAENLMIVDLLRNDLSRACAAGTVRVPELFALEHYSTVHHLVSTVVGELAPGRDAVDLLCAAFPGGSITGAPKVRAMEIIAELEPSRRGVYCGSVGYLSFTGALDTSIVIRTYLVRDGRAYFSAGGGIVADSEPEAEYQETLDKARALIAALRTAGMGDGGWGRTSGDGAIR